MEQVIDRLPAQADAESSSRMRRKSWQRKVQTPSSGVGRASRGLGTAAHPPRPGGAGCGEEPLLEGRQAPLVVAADPGLNGAVEHPKARAIAGAGDGTAWPARRLDDAARSVSCEGFGQ